MKTKFSLFTRQDGFAISMDAFFALLLLIGLIGFIGTGALNIGEQVPATKVSTLGQNLEDALTSFENTGFLTDNLNPTLDQCKTNNIYEKLKTLLPSNTEANIKITRYIPVDDLATCRNTKNFDDCFLTPGAQDIFEPYKTVCSRLPLPDVICPTTIPCQPDIPTDTEVLAGRKVIMQKQAGNRIGAQDKCTLSPTGGQLKEKKTIPINGFETILNFEEEPVTFTLNTTMKDQYGNPYTTGPPANPLNCYDSSTSPTDQKTQIADVNISAYSGQRDPVSVMLLNDRSGSMAGFDMTVQTKTGIAAPGTCNGGACYACTLSNKNTQFDSFTAKQDVATISLTQSTINRIDAGNKVFARVWPDGYTGTCNALGSMVLWVQRPDSVVEKDSGYNDEEDLPASPAAGNYHALLWDDATTPDSYSAIYLGQEPTNNSIYGPLNFTFPSSSSSYGNIGGAITVSANTTFALKFHFTYSGYSGASQPRLRINRSSSYYPSSPGYVNCGIVGASSGSCDITVIDNDATGSYATSGSYQVQGRMASGSAATFSITATYQMENIIYQTETPASNSLYNGSLSFTSTYQDITGTSITVQSNKTFKLIYHFTYSGNSGGKQVWFNIYKPGSDIAYNCGTASSGSCDITVIDNAPSGTYTQNGTYTVQRKVNSGTATINTTITYDMESCTASNCDPVNYGPDTIGNKTCNSILCSNCPSGTNLSGQSTATGVQTVDAYVVGADTAQDHQRGIYADITNVTVASDAVCKAGLGFVNPIQGSNNNFYFSFAGNNNAWCNQIFYHDEQQYLTQCSNDFYSRPESAAATPPVPLPSGDYNILAWSDKSMSYAIDWKAERIDIAKKAGKTFLNQAHAMGKPQDLFGVTSFSGDDSGGATLWQAMDNDIEKSKSALNKLRPYHGTPMAAGINKARNNIGSSTTNQKFIILLSDGETNVRNGSHYNWTTVGGSIACGSSCSNNDCCSIADAIYEANLARTTNNTTVFVIGIAEQAVFSTKTISGATSNPTGLSKLYVEALKDLAKDSSKYDPTGTGGICFDALGNIKPEARCGRFYYADDPTTLQEIYELIMQEIGKRTGTANVQTNVPTGTEILCKSSCAGGMYCGYSSDSGGTITCSNQTGCTDPADCDGQDADSWHRVSQIVYTSQNVSSPKWVQSFKARIPCDIDQDACKDSSVTFPETDSFIQTATPETIYWEPDTVYVPPKTVCENPVAESCNITVPFNYKDLKVIFTEGTIIPPGKVSLTMKIGNNGYKAVNLATTPLRISFHADTAVGTRLSPIAPFAGQTSGGFTTTITYNSDPGVQANEAIVSGATLNPGEFIEIKGVLIESSGDIYAKIDEGNALKQCPKDDADYISCFEPITFYYVINYATWNKT